MCFLKCRNYLVTVTVLGQTQGPYSTVSVMVTSRCQGKDNFIQLSWVRPSWCCRCAADTGRFPHHPLLLLLPSPFQDPALTGTADPRPSPTSVVYQHGSHQEQMGFLCSVRAGDHWFYRPWKTCSRSAGGQFEPLCRCTYNSVPLHCESLTSFPYGGEDRWGLLPFLTKQISGWWILPCSSVPGCHMPWIWHPEVSSSTRGFASPT